MPILWVLIANRSFAQIFEIKGHGKSIKKVEMIDNPEGRKKSGELYSDKPGRSFDKMGGARHALSSSDAHAHEQQLFVRSLVEKLEKAHDHKVFEQLAIIAPNHFLHELKQTCPDSIKACIYKEVDKDLPASLNQEDLLEHLSKYLDLWNCEKKNLVQGRHVS